jgi:hypothetical protein
MESFIVSGKPKHKRTSVVEIDEQRLLKDNKSARKTSWKDISIRFRVDGKVS